MKEICLEIKRETKSVSIYFSKQVADNTQQNKKEQAAYAIVSLK